MKSGQSKALVVYTVLCAQHMSCSPARQEQITFQINLKNVSDAMWSFSGI